MGTLANTIQTGANPDATGSVRMYFGSGGRAEGDAGLWVHQGHPYGGRVASMCQRSL